MTQEGTEILAIPPGTRLTTLDNGLTIILREDHSAPVVSAQVWCRAGSIDEGRWLGAGLSHLLEHMLFKGTKTRGAGRIDQAVQEVGGYMNAYTSFDRTVFYVNVPNTGARVAVDILCDIAQNATLPEEELEKEKQVILREMDMNQDDPGRRSSRRLFETAYTRSPYRYTVIGYPDIFNEVRQADLAGYYAEKYAPNNLFMVVVGDLQPAAVEAQIREAFRGTKARPLAPVALATEPTQAGQREVVEEAPIELGHFHMAWHIPDVRHPDIAALDVLATLLGSGASSRLYQEVREKQGVVHSADAWTYNPGDPGLFGISAVVDGPRYREAQAALLAEVERLKQTPVSERELSKAVKQFTAATYSTRKTMQGQAQDLGGNWMAASDLNFSERYLAQVKRLQAEDLRRVASIYLTEANRTTCALLPNGHSPRVAAELALAAPEPVRKVVLENGLTLLLKVDRKLPFVEIRGVLRGGVLAETAANNGASLLMAKMLLKGTPTRTAQEIVTDVESMGGSIESYSGSNSFGLSCEVLGSDLPEAFDIFTDVLLRPAFPAACLAREKEVQLAGIRAQRDHLLQSAGQAMRQAMYGPRSYGLNALGTEESVRAMDAKALAALHGQLTAPRNCVLALYGAIDPSEVENLVRQKFGGWKGEASILAQESGRGREREEVVETRDKKQAVIVIGFPGGRLQGAERFALDLLQEALSDLGSRLFLRIREKLGLAYYVGAQNFLGLMPGYFAFYAGTEPAKIEQVRDELLLEAKVLREEGLSAEELVRAKAKVIGHKKIAKQDLGGYAMATALDELFGLGYANSDHEDERYEAVTLEQVQQTAGEYLDPKKSVISIIRPAS